MKLCKKEKNQEDSIANGERIKLEQIIERSSNSTQEKNVTSIDDVDGDDYIDNDSSDDDYYNDSPRRIILNL
jgi:hypothetical protein